MDHNFHQTIHRAFDIDVAPGRFAWDSACRGSEWVSLFREATKSLGRRYACVDAVLILESSVRLIVEMEEASANGFLPARIAGKLTISALCRYCIPRGRSVPIPFHERVSFVQVINSGGLKPGSRKLEQYANLARDIQGRLMPLGSIADYRLIAGDADSFDAGDAGNELRKVVRAVVRSD